MAMAAAGGEPLKTQKLRIMFKGRKLVEVTTQLPGSTSAAEVPRPSGAGLRPLSTGGRQSGSNAGGDGSEQQGSGLPPGMIDFLSREMEECLSPLGSWVDETLAGGHSAAGDPTSADPQPDHAASWQPTMQLPSKGKGAEAAPWWEQASTLGGRSSEACSTHEGAIMDAPSPGSVSNGYTPALRHSEHVAHAAAPSWPPSQAPSAAGRLCLGGTQRPQEKPRPASAPTQPQQQRMQQAAPEPRQSSHPQQQQQQQQQQQRPAQRRSPSVQPAQQPQQQPRPAHACPQAKPRPKPVDWLAAEATPINSSPRRDASPAAQQHPPSATSSKPPPPQQQQRKAGAGAPAAGSSRSGSAPPSAPSSPLQRYGKTPSPEHGLRHSASAASLQRPKVLPAGGLRTPAAGLKRKGSPEAARAPSPKRPSQAPASRPLPVQRPAPKPGSQRPQRGKSPLAKGSQAAGRPKPAAAGRATPAVSNGAAAAVLSRAAAAGEPVGGFAAGQWHGFREGQVVWAKMAGFPHWPAQVQAPTPVAQRVREPGMQRPVFVVFFGTADFQWLPASKLTRFGDNYRARAAGRDAQLQQALDSAWWHIGEPKP